MKSLHTSESGRNAIEMIAIIALMALLILLGLWGFKKASLSAKVNTMTKDMSTAITERRYLIAQGGTGAGKEHRLNTKVGSTQMKVENLTSGDDKGQFTVLLSDQSKDNCQEMKKFNVFTPEKVEINGSSANDCVESNNDVKFFFDPRKNGNTGNTGDDSLKGKCDGVKCDVCKSCNPNTGRCQNDNTITKGDCGICFGGGYTLRSGFSVSECQKCDASTNWKIINQDKDEACYKCENGVKKAKTGQKCDLCGECQENYTCNSDAGKQDNEYYSNTDGVCKKYTERVCPEDKKTSDCCAGTNTDPCKSCDAEKHTFEYTDINAKVSCKGECCKAGSTQCTGSGSCPEAVATECTECQTYNANSGKCEAKTDPCHYCNTINNTWIWQEGKTNFTTCGTQCCEFGCSATNGTECKKSCGFGSQTYNHNTTVADCGFCDDGVVKENTNLTSPDCQLCNNETWAWVNEVGIPQYGVFAGETECGARIEIATLGPYKCNYDIYVKGHIDDTFLVTSSSGESLCTNTREHHWADGILYTIPAGEKVTVWAKDVYCTIIAWEGEMHGSEYRVPVPATVKLQKATHTPGWCNTAI